MTTLYKLTDANMQTYGGFQWELGKPAPRLPKGGDLCSFSFYHAYLSPELAVLLNSLHAEFTNPRIFEAKGRISLRDGQLKVGCKTLTLVREIGLPSVTLAQRVTFGIHCALSVFSYPEFERWARGWLSGEDRTLQSAEAASEAARDTAWGTAWDTQAALCAWASARAAAWAAKDAAWAAKPNARDAARDGARDAAWAARYATTRVARVARIAQDSTSRHEIDFVSIARVSLAK